MPRGIPRSGVRHFRSWNAYRKFNAYIHIHRIPHKPGRRVVIAGHSHKPKVPRGERRGHRTRGRRRR